MSDFHERGVPWYCRSDFKLPKYHPPARDLPPEEVSSRASKMRADRYVRKWIRLNFKEGDLFLVVIPPDPNLPPHEHENKIGAFKELVCHGTNWWVTVSEWVFGENKNRRIGAHRFFNAAVKIDQDGNELPTNPPPVE